MRALAIWEKALAPEHDVAQRLHNPAGLYQAEKADKGKRNPSLNVRCLAG